MKIQCDACSKKEAVIFCCADEAALCHGCDQGVHHANKLASKHQHFSLVNSTPSLPPVCDICQEKRALIFCQEDRAILCRECEVSIHAGNELTSKHNRFLLTGIKLSVDYDSGVSKTDPLPTEPTSQISRSNRVDSVHHKGVSTSSVSEYLIETIPGWHFEDFEDASFGFSQSESMNEFEFEVDNDVLSFWDEDIEKKMSSFWCTTNTSTQSENAGIRVPIAASETSLNTGFKMKAKKCIRKNDALTVPQMIHSHVSSKRPKTLW